MKGLKVYLPEELEKRLRKTSMEVYGYGRGAISKAATEAIKMWVIQHERFLEEVSIPEDPVKAISGILAYVKMSSVELQHEVSKTRAKKALSGT